MEFKEILNHILKGGSLTKEVSYQVFNMIMSGSLTPVQISALLVSLHMKGETWEEIVGASRSLREHAFKPPVNLGEGEVLMDIVGTGGDNTYTFNISTAAAIVVAAGGVKVAKHGNRSVSSKCGSADVLEALGVNINLTPEAVARCIGEVGIGFLFAQRFHPAMKIVAPVRQELGIRTIFNMLGPLVNPAPVNTYLIGVFSKRLLEIYGRALLDLGVKRSMIVHGADGMDEISITGENLAFLVDDGRLIEMTIKPDDFGIPPAKLSDIQGDDANVNAKFILEVFNGIRGPKLDVVSLNAGVAFFLADKVSSIQDGVNYATELILSGKALKKLKEFIEFTKDYGKHTR